MNALVIRRIACSAVVLAAWPAAPSLATSGVPNWSQSLVSGVDPSYTVSHPDLAFDHYGTPSISWSAVGAIGMTNYVRQSNLTGLGFWSHRDIVSGIGLGLRTAINFDRSERPTVAWVNDSGGVQAAFNYGSVQTVAASGANINPPTLSLQYDLTGTMRGMYGNVTAGAFSSIAYSGSTFSSGAMANLSGVSSIFDAQFAVDHRGLRHLAARANLTAGGQGVVLASEPLGGGPWTSSVLTTADSVDGIDVAVDPADGLLSIAYATYTSSNNTSSLYYRKFSNGSPPPPAILQLNTQRYYDVSLAFDRSDGRPAIAYERQVYSPAAQQIWYAYLDAASAWQTTQVADNVALTSPNGLPRGPSLAFDDYGTSWPAIAYVDGSEQLWVAFDPPAPEPTAATLLLAGGVLARATRSRPRSSPRPRL